MPAEQRLERAHREGAGEVVDAAIALGLAENRDDPGRIDGAVCDRTFERPDIVRASHRQAVDVSAAQLGRHVWAPGCGPGTVGNHEAARDGVGGWPTCYSGIF